MRLMDVLTNYKLNNSFNIIVDFLMQIVYME